ncbi:hypothetical protein EV182_002768 [Spiromyces aspiralis]|uniref:Uncharacterized protein n=1 Tax=Spiromyces aspiralis TaxID=68401 RepID=A0ACC1HSS0_9FUNG|nr:hypothetical protein EV182_002768 [Spiromyces aspiralis]
MFKRAQSDGTALPRKRTRSSTVNSTGSNRASARVTGNMVSVGKNDWIRLVRDKKLLVDKTDLLLHVMKNDSSDIIFRSRRFGKTMALKMIRDFLNVAGTEEELAERKRLFEDMSVHSADPTFVDKHCGKYPVIYLSLKDVRPTTLDEFRDSMALAIFMATDNWLHAISDTSKAELNDIRDWINQMKSNMRNSIDDSVAIPTLLVKYLSRYYNEQCVVLVDEFDAPVISAPEGIREEIKKYMRRLLSPLAKDDDNVRKFIMAGIDPVNLNTFGSGLNNCKRYPLHEDSDRSRESASPYQFAFGFTEEEVDALIDRVADKMGLLEWQADQLKRVARKWYNGYYACRGVRLYNPWSIMNYIENISKSKENCLEAVKSGCASRYWLSTDDKTTLARYFNMAGGTKELIPVIQELVIDFLKLVDATDESVTEEPASNYVPRFRVNLVDFKPATQRFGDAVRLPSHIDTASSDGEQQWVVSIANSVQGAPATGSLNINEFMTLLYYHGYLSIKDKAYLTIPNYEVLCAWLDLIGMGSSATRLISGMDGRPVLVDHLLSGRYLEFIKHLERILEVQKQGFTIGTYEVSYQMLMSLMLSVFLDSAKYDVAREVVTNQGRADIVVMPRRGAADDGSGRGPMGVLIEIKRADPTKVDADNYSRTIEDARFIADESKDRTERACKRLGKKTFGCLKRLLAEGYNQTIDNKYLDTFNGCCDEALVVVVSFSSGRYLFQFEHFKRLAGDWCLDTERHPIVDYLACPYNWPAGEEAPPPPPPPLSDDV